MKNKTKLLNLGLLLTSLIGYLEWGNDQHLFLFQGELDLLSKLFQDPLSVLHPLILLPLFGQVALIITLFQKQPGKKLTLFGLGGMGILLLVIFLAGVFGPNFKVIFSTLPFFAMGIVTVRHHVTAKSKAV